MEASFCGGAFLRAWEWVVALGVCPCRAIRRAHNIAVCVLLFRVLGTLGVAWGPPPCSFVVCRQLASAQVLASPCGSARDGGNQVALPAGLCLAVGNVQVGGALAGGAVPRVNGRHPPAVVASGLPGESEVISRMSEIRGDCHTCVDQSQGHLITIGLERFEASVMKRNYSSCTRPLLTCSTLDVGAGLGYHSALFEWQGYRRPCHKASQDSVVRCDTEL